MSGPCCGMDAELLVRNAILIPVSQHLQFWMVPGLPAFWPCPNLLSSDDPLPSSPTHSHGHHLDLRSSYHFQSTKSLIPTLFTPSKISNSFPGLRLQQSFILPDFQYSSPQIFLLSLVPWPMASLTSLSSLNCMISHYNHFLFTTLPFLPQVLNSQMHTVSSHLLSETTIPGRFSSSAT